MGYALRRHTATLTLAAALLAITSVVVAIGQLLPAHAIRTPDQQQIAVIGAFRVFAANGYVSLPDFSGAGDGISAAQCAGGAPLGGKVIPAMVATDVRPDLTWLRVLNAHGEPLTGAVVVTCTLTAHTVQGLANLTKLQRWAAQHAVTQ